MAKAAAAGVLLVLLIDCTYGKSGIINRAITNGSHVLKRPQITSADGGPLVGRQLTATATATALSTGGTAVSTSDARNNAKIDSAAIAANGATAVAAQSGSGNQVCRFRTHYSISIW